MDVRSQRRQLRITGLVQGVGFRPFLWRLAGRHGLGGWVANDAAGVVVEIAGEPQAVAAFVSCIPEEAPPLAIVEQIVDLTATTVAEGEPSQAPAAFVIRPSQASSGGAAVLPADVGPCSACLSELRDPTNRRFRYPFLNCTDCGPRFTIITSLPYDRPRTTMAGFAMCEACRREYTDPADRRFHAQPIACPACGPVVWYADTNDLAGRVASRPSAGPLGEVALSVAREQLRAGRILAIKGVGGFQLVCDATDAEAVARLRSRKQRPRKPFAVMVRDRAAAEALTTISDQAAGLLGGPARPIVLLPRRQQPEVHLAEAVVFGGGFLGVMLPSSPLHELLIDDDPPGVDPLPPLVVTSGNLAEEPIIHDNVAAAARLAAIADGFLMHDRPIHVPCDDSVVRCVAGLPLPIRLARGDAPQTFRLADDGPCVLAVGGELKATLCLAHDRRAILSQHLGNIASPESLDALTAAAHHLQSLSGTTPERIVADLHPGYLSTQWARAFAESQQLPLVQVQHHEAHAAALLAEHGCSLQTAKPVLVACFDGTGYGRDGSIQGGEFLLVHEGRMERVAHLEAFPLPGGEAAIREPWRIAVGLLASLGDSTLLPWPRNRLPAAESTMATVRRQAAHGLACPQSTSMGRLFDAAASLTGLCHAISFEAEAAMRLEEAAGEAQAARRVRGSFLLPQASQAFPLTIRWQELIRQVCCDVADGVDAADISRGFHDAVARLIVDVAARVHQQLQAADPATGLRQVGLTGGVFQNQRLCEQTLALLSGAGFEPLLPTRLPANDGGLSLGQAILGRH